jgi:hypothetical protein
MLAIRLKGHAQQMAASFYIVIAGDDPGFDTFVNGVALARNEDKLEKLSAQLHIPHLLDFFSADTDSMALLEQEGYKLPTSPSMLPPTQWFSSEDGLEAVSDLHEYLEAHITYLGDDTAAAVQELEEYMTVLEKASARNLRWHLAVSWR